jgi:hypothetical protein
LIEGFAYELVGVSNAEETLDRHRLLNRYRIYTTIILNRVRIDTESSNNLVNDRTSEQGLSSLGDKVVLSWRWIYIYKCSGNNSYDICYGRGELSEISKNEITG